MQKRTCTSGVLMCFSLYVKLYKGVPDKIRTVQEQSPTHCTVLEVPTSFGLLTKKRMAESEKGSVLPHPPFVNKTKQLHYMRTMIPQAKNSVSSTRETIVQEPARYS